MGNSLQDRTVVVVGRGSGIARAITQLARSEGARVVVAGRDKDKLARAYDDPDVTAEVVDVTDDASIASLADRLGPVDHVVSTASARARGKLADLDRKNLQLSFDTKVIGPAMLAKHFAPPDEWWRLLRLVLGCPTPSRSTSAISELPSLTGRSTSSPGRWR